MKLHKKLKILGQEYSVYLLPNKKMKGKLGECNVNDREILIRETLKGDKFREVFLHEIIHAIAEMLNLDMTENQVNNVAVGLTALINDNTEFLSEEENVK